MKINLVFCVVLPAMLLTVFAGCRSREQKDGQAAGKGKPLAMQAEDIYTCSMHPQIAEHHPGNCPICGMTLIKKNPAPIATDRLALETLLKPANGSVLSSLAVVRPERRDVAIPVTAYGTIEYDPRNAATISARIAGRIEKMYIRYRYQEVKKGQKVMDIYSPELLTAEQNLLFLLQNDGGNDAFIQAAKERLRLLGMGEEQLAQIVKSGKPLYAVSIYSNYSGHVHEAGMMQDGSQRAAVASAADGDLTQELSLKEGMYVQKGQTLLMIMDHHRVWAAVQIFSSDQSRVKAGDAVRIVPEADSSMVIEGRVDLLEPFFRPNSNTLTARVYFHNEGMLPVGSHVVATISGAKKDGLWLPQSAVLSLGLNQVVFKKSEGGFAVHKIRTGIRSGGEVEILAGLVEADSVAANSQYFIDSESFIQSSN
jgi:membrane fusion protein, copper/silver efflux system